LEEFTFLDLAVLKKIDAEAAVEKFGSIISTSFFETANLLGTMKVKGLIDIESSVGGMSRIILTDEGRRRLQIAFERATEPVDALDNAILKALASGARDLPMLKSMVNVRDADIAYHMNKLVEQQFVDYMVKSGGVGFSLTEKGFNVTGGIKTVIPSAAEQQAASSRPAAVPAEPAGQMRIMQQPLHPSQARSHGAKMSEDVSEIVSGSHVEGRQSLKTKRMMSKTGYYMKEYFAYFIIVVLLAILLLFALSAGYLKLSG
jgi:hypothetical protein